jgi:hypothetical protein
MSMTPENTARAWRDIADQLTPEQIAELKDSEQGYRYRATLPKPGWSTEPRSDTDISRLLLSRAQRDAARNLDAAMIGNVPDPAGAVKVCEWDDPGTPDAFRLFWGATREVELQDGAAIEVVTRGTQSADGCVEERGILIYGGSDDVMTTESARQLAAALLEAAGDIERCSR